MKNKMIKYFVGAALFIAGGTTHYAAAALFAINVYAIHSGSNIVYRYQIMNNSTSIIGSVELGTQDGLIGGVESAMPGLPWRNSAWALNDNFENQFTLLPASECKPFAGMSCKVAFNPEYFPTTTLFEMVSLERDVVPPLAVFSSVHQIKPGMLSSVAEITVPQAYQSTGYLTARGTLRLFDNNTKNPDGSMMYKAEIPFTKLDAIAPTLRVTLTPTTLTKSQRGKLVPITATITVSDNYDPAPDIQLVSITANEVLSASDVKNATLGTNDRSFSLMAAHKISTTTARVYTVTYSATDASGNKSLATATVSAL